MAQKDQQLDSLLRDQPTSSEYSGSVPMVIDSQNGAVSERNSSLVLPSKDNLIQSNNSVTVEESDKQKDGENDSEEEKADEIINTNTNNDVQMNELESNEIAKGKLQKSDDVPVCYLNNGKFQKFAK